MTTGTGRPDVETRLATVDRRGAPVTEARRLSAALRAAPAVTSATTITDTPASARTSTSSPGEGSMPFAVPIGNLVDATTLPTDASATPRTEARKGPSD